MPLKSMPCGKPLFFPSKQYITTAFYIFVGTAVKTPMKKPLAQFTDHLQKHPEDVYFVCNLLDSLIHRYISKSPVYFNS